MSRIYVETGQLRETAAACSKAAGTIQSISSDFSDVIRNLDWDIRSQMNVASRAQQLCSNLESSSRVLLKTNNLLEVAATEYERLENYQNSIDYSSLISSVSGQGTISSTLPAFSILTNLIQSINKDSSDKDTIPEFAEKSAKYIGKTEENDGAVFFSDIIAYLRSFIDFYTEDKSGSTGAKNWADLSKDSIGLWTGLYDYLKNIYGDVNLGIFSESNQATVAGLGIIGSFTSLISSLIDAGTGWNDKTVLEIMSGYIDSGKDIAKIIKSTYKLDHIGDTSSLLTQKTGAYSALDYYMAIANGAIEFTSQGFESISKYSADSIWDWGDTGATGVDCALAGFHGIASTLTFGLDDAVFDLIKELTGWEYDGNWADAASDGLKAFAEWAGTGIGNLILKFKNS